MKLKYRKAGLLQLVNLHGNVLFMSERTDLPRGVKGFAQTQPGWASRKKWKQRLDKSTDFYFAR